MKFLFQSKGKENSQKSMNDAPHSLMEAFPKQLNSLFCCAKQGAIPSPPCYAFPRAFLLFPELFLSQTSFSCCLHHSTESLSHLHPWFWGLLPSLMCLRMEHSYPWGISPPLATITPACPPHPHVSSPCTPVSGAGPGGKDPKELTLWSSSPLCPREQLPEPAIPLRIWAGQQRQFAHAAVGNRAGWRDGAESRSPFSGDTEEDR